MALIKPISLPSGLEVPDAYLRIQYVSGNKDALFLEIKAYVNQEAANTGLEHISASSHTFVPDISETSLRWDKQGYEYLKTLPEFDGAVDC